MAYTLDSDTGSPRSNQTHSLSGMGGLNLLSHDIVMSTADSTFRFNFHDANADQGLADETLTAEVARIIDAAHKGAGRWDNDAETSFVSVGDKVWTLTFANDDVPAPEDWWRLEVSEELFIGTFGALHALAVKTLWGNDVESAKGEG